MSKPRVPDRRTTSWRPTPQEDRYAQTISAYLQTTIGQEVGHTGALRYALKFAAEALRSRTPSGASA